MYSPTPIIRVFAAFSLAVGWGTATLCTEAAAVETVSIVFGNDSPQLERLAANELASQFRRLFQNVTVTVGMEPTGEATHVVLVGSPETNVHVRALAGSSWPKLSDQGLVLRRLDTDRRPTLIVGGGSPPATLWAAYPGLFINWVSCDFCPFRGQVGVLAPNVLGTLLFLRVGPPLPHASFE